jgi:hypothetical protein
MGLIKKWNKVNDLTIDEKQNITKQQMRSMIVQLFEQMKLTYIKGSKLVYNNPLGLSKEQVIAGFGDDAMELIRLSMLLKDCLNVAVPGTVPDDGNPYT